MLTFILIGGLVWLVVALVLVLALAAAARKQVSPVAVNPLGEPKEQENSRPIIDVAAPSLVPNPPYVEESIAT